MEPSRAGSTGVFEGLALVNDDNVGRELVEINARGPVLLRPAEQGVGLESNGSEAPMRLEAFEIPLRLALELRRDEEERPHGLVEDLRGYGRGEGRNVGLSLADTGLEERPSIVVELAEARCLHRS